MEEPKEELSALFFLKLAVAFLPPLQALVPRFLLKPGNAVFNHSLKPLTSY